MLFSSGDAAGMKVNSILGQKIMLQPSCSMKIAFYECPGTAGRWGGGGLDVVI